MNSLSSFSSVTIFSCFGIVTYIIFAFLVTHLKKTEIRRRWRYSVLWGIGAAVGFSVILGIVFVGTLLTIDANVDFLVLLKHPNGLANLLIGLLISVASMVPLCIPFMFFITLVTFWREYQSSDLLIGRILHPVRHFSYVDTSLYESLIELIRRFITQ